jgi:hypothetical protein
MQECLRLQMLLSRGRGLWYTEHPNCIVALPSKSANMSIDCRRSFCTQSYPQISSKSFTSLVCFHSHLTAICHIQITMWSTLLFVALSHLVGVSMSLVDPNDAYIPAHYSMLKAARKHRDLFPRYQDFAYSQEVQLAYAEPDTRGPVITSHIVLQANRPTLLFEDNDHLLEAVECSGSRMTITLKCEDSYRKAIVISRLLVGGLLVSSHHTCADDGAHTVYRQVTSPKCPGIAKSFRVMSTNFINEALQINFDLEKSAIEDEFEHATLSFASSHNRPAIHRHDRLFPRRLQEVTPTGNIPFLSTATVPLPTESVVRQDDDTLNTTDLSIEII